MGKGPVCNIEDSPFYVFRACARGLADTVEKLIEEDRGRATGKDTKGWTCMHHAASRDKVIIMDLVMKFSNATLNAVNSDGNTPLHLAAEGNRKNAVRHLLILGADPNILNHKAMAPLHLATNNSHHLVIKELLANPKVDVNLKSKNGSTAVHLAAVLNHKETTTALVEGAANLCQPNSHGFYPIHLAAKHASNDALEIILRAAEDGGVSREKMFSFLDAENNSPLHSAVNGGDSEAVRMCVLNGAKVDARSDDDATPFHLACNQGSLDIVRLMLDIFEKDHGDITELLEAEDINGLTPLHRAAVYDHPEVVRFLISKEANYEAKDVDGRTPLLLCAAKGGAASLRALMEAGASVSVRDTSSKNVLHFLVAHGERMTPELELIYSSPRGRQLLDQQDVAGCTPLHLATRSGNLAFLDSLLSLGAKVATKDNADQSVLHFAARYGRTNTVRKLLEHSGRIMNETDGVGMTPLHVASACGHAKVVSLLLQRGALIHKDFTGQSPLHLAAERGHTQAMKLLLSFHRNLLDVGDKRGNSALHLAAMADEAASVELLLSWEAKFTPNVEHKTPLDLAIEHLCEDAALVMVNDHRWKEFLSVTSEQYGSPLLGLIQYLPNVQKAVLDRCRTPSKAHAASRHYWEKYDFSLMEAPMGTAAKLAQQLSDNGEGRVRIKQALLCANTMVRFGRVNLLSHPVCLAYLNMKWRAYGSSVFYVNLLLYLGFLSCMTWLMTAMVIDGSVSPHLDHDYPHRQVLVSPLNYTFKVRLGFLSCMTWLMTAMVIDGSVSPHLDHDYPHRQVLVSPLNYTFKVRLGFLSCMTWLMTAMVIDGSVSPHLDHDYPHRQVLVSPLNYTFKVRLGFLSCMTWLMTAMVIDGSVSPHLDHDYPHRQVLVSPLNYTFKVRLGFLSCMTWLMTAMVIDGSVSPHLDHDYPQRQVLVSPLNYTFKVRLGFLSCMTWLMTAMVIDGSVSPHLDHDYPHRQVLVSPLNYTFKVRLGFLSCMTWLMTAMVIDGSVSPHLDHDYPHRQVLVSPLNYTFKVRLGFLSCMTWLMTAMVIDGSVSPHLDHDYPQRQVLVSPLNYTFKVRLGFLSCMTWLMTAMVIDGSVSPHLDHDYPHRQVLVSPLNYTFKPHLSYYQECMEWEKRGAVVFIVAFLILNYAKEFLQIYQQKIMYFLDLVNVIEWSLYVSAMIFVGPLLFEGGMREFQWQFGTVALFLSWFNVLMHLQRTESMGLYVVMFLHIFRTVMKVITIFSVLFIGFGLAFHILFTNDPARGWDGPVTSIVQSVMMMMGEWYFLHNYVDPREGEAPYALPFPRLSMLFLLAFVLLMPILFINLLIGLAVGDIEMVQKDARLKRLAMQVEYHTELEDRLPKFLKKRIMRSESIIYPNRISSTDLLASVVRWIHLISGRQEEVRIRDTSMVSLQERRTLEILANMAQLHKRIQQVELEHAMRLEKQMDMLRLLAQKMEIHSEADVFDEGDVFHSGPNSRASNDNLPISEDLISIAELALPEVSPPSRRGGGVFHSGPNSRASNDNLPISEDLISIAELALPEVSPPSRRGGGVFHSGPNSRASNDNLPISEDLISIAELALPEVSPPSRRAGGCSTRGPTPGRPTTTCPSPKTSSLSPS